MDQHFYLLVVKQDGISAVPLSVGYEVREKRSLRTFFLIQEDASKPDLQPGPRDAIHFVNNLG